MTLISIGIIVTALISTLLILLQERGSDGAGSIFGGGEGGAYQHRRGAEKFMFVLTILSVATVAVFCILNLTYPDKGTVTTSPNSDVSPIQIDAKDSSGNPVKVDVTPASPSGNQ